MTHARILTYITSRLSQIVGWTTDTNALAEPLIQKEKSFFQRLPEQMYKGPLRATSRVMEYAPPPYKQAFHFPKLKG